MSTIHLIGGEKGGVGKSVVARLLCQYFIDHEMAFTALDADGSHGALLRHYAAYAHPVDLARFESADEIMKLALDTDCRVLVDLPAQSERALAAWMAESGILELATETGVRVVFWHVMDGGKDSLNTLERLLERHRAAAHYCIVKNLGRSKDFTLFDHSPSRARAESLNAKILELPELNEVAMQKVDRLDASFWAAVHNEAPGEASLTRMDRQRVKVWLQACSDRLARVADTL